jgi:hypothetical protein
MIVSEVVDYTSRSPEEICASFLDEILRKGVYADRFVGEAQMLLAIGAEHQRYFLDAGWSKDDIRQHLWERSRSPEPGQRPVLMGGPEGFLLVAAGGRGHATTWLFFPHLAWAVTQPIEDRRT